MNWQAIGTIAEIVASVMVVISVVYLGLQIKHAAEQTRMEALRNTLAELNQFCDLIASSKEVAAVVVAGRDSLQSLKAEERLIFDHIHLRLLNTLEGWHFQSLRTIKTADEMRAFEDNFAAIVRGYLGYPGTRELWPSLRDFFVSIEPLVLKGLEQPDKR